VKKVGVALKKNQLSKLAEQRRLEVLEMVYQNKAGHIGGSMSCMEILVSLYYSMMNIEKIKNKDLDRDRFIMGKGHCAEALYTVLADTGFFPKEELKEFVHYGGRLAEHPTTKLPGIEFATGALGHGLSLGTGLAIGFQMNKNPAHVYVLMGDGEQDEGSVWEAAMAASKYRLDNLTAIVDRNRLQISGDTEAIMPLGSLAGKYRAFGFEAVECDGHDPQDICRALSARTPGKPLAVIANTVKGKGITVFENRAESHQLIPTTEEYLRTKEEITKRLEDYGDER